MSKVALAVVGLCLLTACSAAESLGVPGFRDPKTISTAEGTILVAGFTRDANEAVLEGRLTFTADGCLGFAGPDEDVATAVAAFPAGTKLVEVDPLTVRVNGNDVQLGEVFSGGGGEVSSDLNLLSAGPKKCLAARSG